MLRRVLQITMGGLRYALTAILAAAPVYVGWMYFLEPAGFPELTYIQVAGIMVALMAAEGLLNELGANSVGEFIVIAGVFFGIAVAIMRLLLLF